MSFYKLTLIFIINFIFIPLYCIFLILCFALTFIPIFPTRTAKENLKNHLQITGIKFHFYLTIIFLNYFFYLIEAVILWPLRLSHCILEDSSDVISAMQNAKNIYPESKNVGFVYLLPHMSNVEMFTISVIQAHKTLGLKDVVALAKPSKLKFINKLFLWYRKRPGFNIIWTDKNLLLNMQNAISNGLSIGMLVDQKPKTGGVFLKFFENYAAFPISGLRYCINKNMIVFYISGYRIIPGIVRMKIKIGKNVHLLKNNSAISSQIDLQTDIWKPETINIKDKLATLEMSYFVPWSEQEIKKHPRQWCWDYKKWSRKLF